MAAVEVRGSQVDEGRAKAREQTLEEKRKINGISKAMPAAISVPGSFPNGLDKPKTNGVISGKIKFGVDSSDGDVKGERETKVKAVMANGVHTNGERDGEYKPQSQHAAADADEQIARPLPPEIPHYTNGYVKLSTLISRLAQETFNDLQTVINDMAEMPAQQSGPNGVVNHFNRQVNGNSAGNSEANVQKKLRLLNFTNLWRPKFIKLLVLSQWARQADAVSKVIDLKLWQDMQEQEYDSAATEIGQLHRIIAPLKDPSPDIETALQVLLQGKSSRLSDLGYLPIDPLTPQQQLEVLRRINTLLSIRLNLHESIPPVFRDFSIASGRVTFRVPDEFEVDLSIADGDPASQFFFIDFRFAFSPGGASLPSGRFQADLQGRCNDILGRQGLQGLFDLLHNFVLTHKLSILRSQAYDMIRGYWSEHIVIEPIRRSLIIQYWSNRLGAKNWLEIGIRKGAEKRFTYAEISRAIPQLGIRCFRAGKEIADLTIDLRLGDLSMEAILKQVIAHHTSIILEGISKKLQAAPLYSSGSLKIRNRPSSFEPTAASLLVQVTTSKVIKLLQEPVTGRFAVQPNTQINQKLEFELNRVASPVSDCPNQVLYLRSLALQDEIAEIATAEYKWKHVRSLNPSKEIMRQTFPKGTQQTTFLRPPSWNDVWALAFTTNTEGDSWWIVQLPRRSHALEAKPSNSDSTSPLRAAYKIQTYRLTSLAFDASSATLAHIERTAVGMVCQFEDSQDLNDKKIPHIVQRPVDSSSAFSIYLRYRSKALSSPNPHARLAVPWAHEVVRLDYRGLNAERTVALRVASARLKQPPAKLKDLVSAISSLAMDPVSGALAFQLTNSVGESCVSELTQRLSATERLLEFASAIKESQLAITSASLTHLEFVYQKLPSLLKATVHFPNDAPVRLSFSARNPHLRILDYLRTCLVKHGIKSLIANLKLTLPLLISLANLEARHTSADYGIIARTEHCYIIRYLNPLPKGGFEIQLRNRRGAPMWFISEASLRKPEGLVDEEAWNASFVAVTRGKGEDWRGMHGGIVAGVKGIAEVIQQLDDVFRSAKASSPPTTSPTTETAAPAIVPTAGAKETSKTQSPKAKRKAETQVVEID